MQINQISRPKNHHFLVPFFDDSVDWLLNDALVNRGPARSNAVNGGRYGDVVQLELKSISYVTQKLVLNWDPKWKSNPKGTQRSYHPSWKLILKKCAWILNPMDFIMINYIIIIYNDKLYIIRFQKLTLIRKIHLFLKRRRVRKWW